MRKTQYNVISLFLLVFSLMIFPVHVVRSSEIHDVAVVDVLTSSTWIVLDELCAVNATIENQGTTSETFNVTAYSNNYTFQTITVSSLAAGANTTLTFIWFPFPIRWFLFESVWSIYPPANLTIEIKVEADVVSGEVDTADNVYIDGTVTVTWMIPDIDGNGKIGMRDIGMVARNFGGYDYDCDFNRDEEVDMRDVGVSARYYGMVYL